MPILDNGDVHCCKKVKIRLDYVKFFLDYDAIYMNASSTEKLLLTPPLKKHTWLLEMLNFTTVIPMAT